MQVERFWWKKLSVLTGTAWNDASTLPLQALISKHGYKHDFIYIYTYKYIYIYNHIYIYTYNHIYIYITPSADDQTYNYNTECSNQHLFVSTLRSTDWAAARWNGMLYTYKFSSKCHSQSNPSSWTEIPRRGNVFISLYW